MAFPSIGTTFCLLSIKGSLRYLLACLSLQTPHDSGHRLPYLCLLPLQEDKTGTTNPVLQHILYCNTFPWMTGNPCPLISSFHICPPLTINDYVVVLLVLMLPVESAFWILAGNGVNGSVAQGLH